MEAPALSVCGEPDHSNTWKQVWVRDCGGVTMPAPGRTGEWKAARQGGVQAVADGLAQREGSAPAPPAAQTPRSPW